MIYVECNPDKTLVRFLGVRVRDIEHGGGKSEVCKRISKLTNCRAMLDEDPASMQPSYLVRMNMKVDMPDKSLRVFHDPKRNNHVVLLRPRLEEWILGAALDMGLDLGKYGLPTTARALKRVINLRLDQFERSLQALKASDRIKALRRELKRRCRHRLTHP